MLAMLCWKRARSPQFAIRFPRRLPPHCPAMERGVQSLTSRRPSAVVVGQNACTVRRPDVSDRSPIVAYAESAGAGPEIEARRDRHAANDSSRRLGMNDPDIGPTVEAGDTPESVVPATEQAKQTHQRSAKRGWAGWTPSRGCSPSPRTRHIGSVKPPPRNASADRGPLHRGWR